MHSKNRVAQFISIFLALTISGQVSSQLPAAEAVRAANLAQSDERALTNEETNLLSITTFAVGSVLIVGTVALVVYAVKKSGKAQQLATAGHAPAGIRATK